VIGTDLRKSLLANAGVDRDAQFLLAIEIQFE